MLLNTPPMGWNSWNTFANEVSETVVKESAEAMRDTGLLDAGYRYVVIDDCWQAEERGKDLRLRSDPVKFPRGIKPLADDIHRMGMKIGLYSCTGTRTCARMPGSFEYEYIDAETFASWGIDYLKYDHCFHPLTEEGRLLYLRMGTALANCGRDVVFSACNWGNDDAYRWVRTTGANLWRSTLDVYDSWESVRERALLQKELHPYGTRGCFNDMDMLVVGMNGKGYAGLSGCTSEEYRTHFSFWAMMASPLMIGCDVRNMTEETKKILLNRDVIAIDQDPGVRQPFLINPERSCSSAWVRQLANGDLAIGAFNFEDHDSLFITNLTDIGLGRICGKQLLLRDLWTGEDRLSGDVIYDTVPAHGCIFYRARVTDRS